MKIFGLERSKMNEQNIAQAKFLIKELRAILYTIPESEYDEELKTLIEELEYELRLE